MIVDYSLPVLLILFFFGGIGYNCTDKYFTFEVKRILDSFVSNIFSVWTISKPLVLFMFALYIYFVFQVVIILSYFLMKGENYDLKQIQQPHDSHMHALSQLCPSNLNGGPFLT